MRCYTLNPLRLNLGNRASVHAIGLLQLTCQNPRTRFLANS